MIPYSPLAGPAARKISSSQIPVAFWLGLPPQRSQVRRLQLLPCCFLLDLSPNKKPKYPDCSCSLQPSYWACRLNKTQASVRGHTTACEPLSHAGKGRFVQDLFNLLRVKPKLLGLTPKKPSSKIAIATLQPSCWACRHKNLKYAECSSYPPAFFWACYQTI